MSDNYKNTLVACPGVRRYTVSWKRVVWHGRVRPRGARVPARPELSVGDCPPSSSSACGPDSSLSERPSFRLSSWPPAPRAQLPCTVRGAHQPRARQQWGQFSPVRRLVSGATSSVDRLSPPHCHLREPPERSVTAGPANQPTLDHTPHGGPQGRSPWG